MTEIVRIRADYELDVEGIPNCNGNLLNTFLYPIGDPRRRKNHVSAKKIIKKTYDSATGAYRIDDEIDYLSERALKRQAFSPYVRYQPRPVNKTRDWNEQASELWWLMKGDFDPNAAKNQTVARPSPIHVTIAMDRSGKESLRSVCIATSSQPREKDAMDQTEKLVKRKKKGEEVTETESKKDSNFFSLDVYPPRRHQFSVHFNLQQVSFIDQNPYAYVVPPTEANEKAYQKALARRLEESGISGFDSSFRNYCLVRNKSQKFRGILLPEKAQKLSILETLTLFNEIDSIRAKGIFRADRSATRITVTLNNFQELHPQSIAEFASFLSDDTVRLKQFYTVSQE